MYHDRLKVTCMSLDSEDFSFVASRRSLRPFFSLVRPRQKLAATPELASNKFHMSVSHFQFVAAEFCLLPYFTDARGDWKF
jgi:hypothetical protein